MPTSPALGIGALFVGLSLVAACSGASDDAASSTAAPTTSAPAGVGSGPETSGAPAVTASPGASAPRTTSVPTDSAPPAASGTAEADPTCVGDADGVLDIAALLPRTGSHADLGPAAFAAIALALEEIGLRGGVLGADVSYDPGDSGDASSGIAAATVERQVAAGADAVIGAMSSAVSLTVIDQLVESCTIHFSPADTAAELTTYSDDDLYFRTAPSDVLQGRVLADLMIADGIETAGFLAAQDVYGQGLVTHAGTPFTEQGGEILASVSYDPLAPTFESEVGQITSADPEAVVIVGYAETSQILAALFEQGLTVDVKRIYLVDANVGNALGRRLPPGSMTGVKGTRPAAEVSAVFRDRLLGIDPQLVDVAYAPEAYDAVMIIALATELAGTDEPAAIARRINGVTRDGEKCTSFDECMDLIEGGATDIDYDGPSGPQSFGPAGEPTEASFAILTYDSNNEVDGEVPTEYRFAAT